MGKNYDPLGDTVKWGCGIIAIALTLAFAFGLFLGWLC